MRASGLESYKGVAYFEYNFAKHGGAVGAIAVQGDSIPVGALIPGGAIHCKAACTSGGSATVAIHAASAGDILTAPAIASLGLNALVATVPVPQTANTWIRVATAITAVNFTVAVAALTAGRIVVALDYYITTE